MEQQRVFLLVQPGCCCFHVSLRAFLKQGKNPLDFQVRVLSSGGTRGSAAPKLNATWSWTCPS